MRKIGLKLWSTNLEYIPAAIKLFKMGIYHYIELFDVPGADRRCAGFWKKIRDEEGVDYIVHAPHSAVGFDLSHRELLKSNMAMASATFKLADQLQAKYIIFHLGIGGSEEEIVFQIKKISDSRMLIENKPYFPIYGTNAVCNGYSPQSIKYMMEKLNVGFCFDIGHAICAANALKTDRIQFINDFLKLKPRLFHLSDGEFNGIFDKHCNIGEGDFDMKCILLKFPNECLITLEVPRKYKDRLDDYENDVAAVKRLLQN